MSLKLTSYQRMLRYLAGDENTILTDNVQNRRIINTWIASISNKIQTYLNRELEIQTKTQYYELRWNSREFWVDRFPILSITSVETDIEGRYAGSETVVPTTDYHTGDFDESVVLYVGIPYTAKKGIKIVYNGGLAVSGVTSIYETADASAWTTNDFVIGYDSGALGIVKEGGVDSLTVEVLYGVFEVGELLTEYEDEAGTTATGQTLDLMSKTQECLAESHPDIVNACEMEIRYYKSHKEDFENIGTQKDGTTLRRDSGKKQRLPLQPEVLDMVNPYLKPELA